MMMGKSTLCATCPPEIKARCTKPCKAVRKLLAKCVTRRCNTGPLPEVYFTRVTHRRQWPEPIVPDAVTVKRLYFFDRRTIREIVPLVGLRYYQVRRIVRMEKERRKAKGTDGHSE
jgi:hypothetical protein